MFLDRFRKKNRTYKGMFGELEVVNSKDMNGEEVLILRAGSSFQSSVYADASKRDAPFRYIRRFDSMFEAQDGGLAISSVLMLGGGAFSYPMLLLSKHPGTSLSVIEIDPVVVDIAREHFHLDSLEKELYTQGRSGDFEIIVDDGMHFLQSSNATFDVIINDIYQNEVMPSTFSEPASIQTIKDHLNCGGLYMVNASVDLTREGARTIYLLIESLKTAFKEVCILDACDTDFGEADNYIVVASDEKYAFSDTIPLS